jgi:RND family efflux transporter MFP subunit
MLLEQSQETKVLLALLLSIALLAGCTAQSQTRTIQNQSEPKAPVVVRVFDAQPATDTTEGDLLIPGALAASDTAMVLAERDGRVINVSVQEGNLVSTGDTLAQVDDQEQRERIQLAELEVSRLKVEAQQIESLIKLNKSELDRELLLARQGLISTREVEQAQYKLEQSLHEYEKAKLAIESAVGRLREVKLESKKSIVRAPTTGIVTRRYISAGTNAVKDEKLFEVAELTKIELRFRVPQNVGDKLRPGQVLVVSSTDRGSQSAKASITRIDPVADSTSNTFGYVAHIIGKSNLIPGTTVYIHMHREVGPVSFWVPRAAFKADATLKNNSTTTLFVLRGEQVWAASVVIKQIEGDQVEVVGGLAKGDSVVVSPVADLHDGDSVEVSQG